MGARTVAKTMAKSPGEKRLLRGGGARTSTKTMAKSVGLRVCPILDRCKAPAASVACYIWWCNGNVLTLHSLMNNRRQAGLLTRGRTVIHEL